MDGRITPTSQFHVSRAYGTPSPLRVRPVNGPEAIAKLEKVQDERAGLSRLVAGVVQGRIDFSGPTPAQDSTALAMYRHPADRNAAATAVDAGRMLDVTG